MNETSIFSVSELTAAIKQKLEEGFSHLSVRGEVSNLRKQASGHTYFTLKDKDAQISCVLFRGNRMGMTQDLKEGDQVILGGELSVYPPRGNYQFIVRSVEFSGIGELLKQLHALKIKLKEKGWFDPSLKKPLPKLPQKIGVVTSPTGSVIQDILNILSRRYAGFHLILNPVRVQGEEAAKEIAQAIEEFNTYHLVDVIIVARGGGSFEDLWPFNEEVVASAIHESKIPVISAVGHETDFTIADFCADLRSPTPSAAAEIVIEEKAQLLTSLEKAKLRMIQGLQGHLRSNKQLLNTYLKQPSLRSPYSILSPFFQKIDGMLEDIDEAIFSYLSQKKFQLSSLAKQKEGLSPLSQVLFQRKNFEKNHLSLKQAMQNQIRQKRENLENLSTHLKAIDPRNLLKKGYSIVFHEKKDSVILSTKEAKKQSHLRIQLSDGKLRVKVEDE